MISENGTSYANRKQFSVALRVLDRFKVRLCSPRSAA
jgi:hypothetical protein